MINLKTFDLKYQPVKISEEFKHSLYSPRRLILGQELLDVQYAKKDVDILIKVLEIERFPDGNVHIIGTDDMDVIIKIHVSSWLAAQIEKTIEVRLFFHCTPF